MSTSAGRPSTFVKGRQAESLARQTLESAGVRILDQNFRCPSGELDLVGDHDGVLCFVEVRSRLDESLGAPEETLSARKRARVRAGAREWLSARGELGPRPCRFDVIAIVGAGPGAQIRWLRAAFE